MYLLVKFFKDTAVQGKGKGISTHFCNNIVLLMTESKCGTIPAITSIFTFLQEYVAADESHVDFYRGMARYYSLFEVLCYRRNNMSSICFDSRTTEH